MRAGYGKTTRNYFLEYTQPHLLVDLGSGVFDEATVDSNLLIFKKCSSMKPFDALDISKEKSVKDLTLFVNKTLTISPKINESWIISSGIEHNIKQKIEEIGKPLKDWDIKFFRGITTGFNDAFIIDGKKKEELIAQDHKNAEIINPILRGRDIKRYRAEFADLWIINSHNGVKEKNIPRVDIIKDYPIVYKHLQNFQEELKTRQDQGDHWTNLRNCAYLEVFKNEKIIFSKASQQKSFAYDFDCRFLQNTSYFISGNNLKYLLALLNSNFINFAFLKFYQSGGIEGEITLQAIEKIPIPPLSESDQEPFVLLVAQIIAKKEQQINTTELEAQIDQLVYKLYNLTEEEIKIVEGK
jgi:hypothetical protein